MSDWIKCSEYQPLELLRVMVSYRKGLYRESGLGFKDGDHYILDGSLVSAEYVTHWMPLPEPPTE